MATATVIATGLSNIGLIRQRNEDTWAVGSQVHPDDGVTAVQIARAVHEPVLVSVLDGMGGHARGDVASAHAAETLGASEADLHDREAVADALRRANLAVHERMEQDPSLGGMGTTVCLVAATPDVVVVANVGDSRVYAVDGDGIRQLTTDDRSSPHSPMLTQCLGGSYEPATITPHVHDLPLQPAVFLLCSDGLCDVLDDETIAGLLDRDDDTGTVERLVRAALDSGAPDNVTVVLTRILDGPWHALGTEKSDEADP